MASKNLFLVQNKSGNNYNNISNNNNNKNNNNLKVYFEGAIFGDPLQKHQ